MTDGYSNFQTIKAKMFLPQVVLLSIVTIDIIMLSLVY